MEFNKAYSRQEFVNFLQNSFLPEDFIHTETPVEFRTKMTYTRHALKLGTSAALDLVVYEVRHNSKNDARVSLSKEAFRLLADEMEDRALVVFVPEDNNDNYRFSLIEITLEAADNSARVTRNYSNPRRYSYFLGKGIAYYTPNKYLNEKGRVVDPDDLRSRFSVEVLTKEFYQELSDWYAWAIKIIRFPNDLNDKADDDKFNNESAIRLITRLIFVWFLKQRHLIPDEFFDEKYIADNLIKDFNPNTKVDLFYKSSESKYYKAILQNLFFAMLNSPITPEGSKELSERHFRNGRGDYDNNKLMRYESYFKNPQLFVDLANRTVPFLNGGLFDCLDDKDNDLYYDGFSDREAVKKSLIVPDYLFFGEEAGKNIDLSEWYGSKKKKKVSARGIIDILKRYNFTVEENTPFDKEVSLDPELLGKVFENLLASYNPETQTTARKQTGSFYTPREIVQYMVDESLVAHLKRTVGDDLEQQYRQLMQYTDEDVSLTDDQRRQIMLSLYNCKVLDPACGSGAFPMGILQQMVHILSRIDPDNKMWKEIMLQKAIDETSEAYRNSSNEERKELIADIERSFDESINRPDYARKLYLIENCIYGVDIQPIAIQISKLRFFISLVVDQNTNTDPTDNFGIRPLPNLEAKFVAANTLIGLDKKDASLFDSEEIKAKENELKIAKHKIFGAKTVRTKRKYKNIVNDLRQEIADMLYANGAVGNDEARQLASWDMFNQNASSPFFDSEWMFGVKDGFDIVIGNPPYVLISLSLYKKLYSNYYNWQEGKIDLYRLFIECSVKYLMNNFGILVLITPNTFLTIPSCKLLRKRLIELTHFMFIDNYDLTVFDTASVNNVVFGLTKLYIEDKCRVVIHKDKYQTISYIDQANFNKNLGSEVYINVQNDDVQIINKIRNCSSTTLCQCNIQMCLGEQPYHNTIHTREEIKTKFLHSKMQVNSNYMLEYGGKNIIRFGIKERNDNWLDYSGELYTKPEFKFFHNPRIILREIVGKQLVATYTEEEFLVNKSCYIIISKNNDKHFLKYLLGILSSTLIGYYVQNVGDKSKQRLFPRITMSTLKNIPIKVDKYFMEKIINIVDICLHEKRQNLGKDILSKEIEIDLLVYHLYGLTYDEVLIVDPQTTITREEYEKGGIL